MSMMTTPRFISAVLLIIVTGMATGWRLPLTHSRTGGAAGLAGAQNNIAGFKIATLAATGLFLGTFASLPAAHALTLPEFLVKLEAKEIKRVVFNGINPRSATVTYGDGTTAVLDEMPFDDPKGPSGPAQLIAKCQHTLGVVCSQDVSDALRLAKSRATYLGKPLNTLIESNQYPKEFMPPNAAVPTTSGGGAAAAAASTIVKEYF